MIDTVLDIGMRVSLTLAFLSLTVICIIIAALTIIEFRDGRRDAKDDRGGR